MRTSRIMALQHTELFGCLTAEELDDIAQRAADLHFKKGEMLFFSGEQAKGLFVIVNGEIRVFQQNAEGREQVMHIDTAGSVVAEVAVFDGGPYPASAISESDVDVLFIDKRDVHDLCKMYPALALQALKLMAQRVRRHAQLVESLCFHEVGQRLALFLLTRAQNTGTPQQDRAAFHLPLSHHEIAIRIGSVRDVVARAFARLKHDGLITAEGHEVTIPNVRALKLYADAGVCGPPSSTVT
jgi:CRP/FNR family cyclic AMP-dependent transcriptional regulator